MLLYTASILDYVAKLHGVSQRSAKLRGEIMDKLSLNTTIKGDILKVLQKMHRCTVN